MPGVILEVEGTKILGCAWHPRFRAYEVLVHVVVGTAIVRSLFANERLQHEDLPQEGVGHGFTVNVAPFGVAAEAIDRVRLLIGETDEWLELPLDRSSGEVTVEDIIAEPFRRKWVTGRIYFDAQLAGFSAETIVDLFYRDYLGRRADPEGLANYSGRIKDGSLSYDGFRRILVSSQEYALRRWQTYEAPGAIFSQGIVVHAGRELQPEKEGAAAKERSVSLRGLLALDGVDFIFEAYRQLIGKPPKSAAAWRHLAELRAGSRKLDILRELFADPAAIARNIRVVDFVEEPEPASAPAVRGRRQRPQVVAGDGAGRKPRESAAVLVPLIDLLQPDGAKFVSEAYRRILGRQPSAGEAAFCAKELAAGGKKREILSFLVGEPEAIARNVKIVDRPDLSRRPGAAAAAPEAVIGPAPAALAPAPADAEEDVVGFGELAPEPLLFGRTAAGEEAAAGAEEAAAGAEEAAVATTVVLAELLELEEAEFVVEAYRRVLGRMPDEEAVRLHLTEIASGRDRGDFLRTLAEDAAGGARGVRLVADAGAALLAHAEGSAEEADMASIDAQEEVEELVSGGWADEAAAPEPAANGEEYRPFGDPNSLEGPLVGAGFHPAETNGAGWWRWTGPGRQARIRLPVAGPGQYRVAIWCEKAPPAVLEGIAIRCCGETAPVLVEARNGAASLVCDAWAPVAGFTGWMDLELEHGPPEQAPDGRLVGLCIGSIQLEE